MSPVKVASSHGYLFRRKVMLEKGLSVEMVMAALECEAPLDINEDLLSLGPFWPDAWEELMRRLKALGLEYVDDYFIFEAAVPEWCQLHVSLAKT
jgi:hypothetical protein